MTLKKETTSRKVRTKAFPLPVLRTERGCQPVRLVNVAHVYDAGTTELGRPYFVMEYVKGVPITEHCDRHNLTIEERLKLFLQVCEAVQHAH